MLRNCKKENGEIMIESMLVLLPTMFVMVFLIALGFLMYQQWNVQYVADSVASRLSVVYSYGNADIKSGEITIDDMEGRELYRYLDLFGGKEKMTGQAEAKGKQYGAMLFSLTNFAAAENETISVTMEDDGIGRRHIVVKVSGDYKIPFGAGLEIFGMRSTRHMEASSAAECVDIMEYFASVTLAKNAEEMLLGNSKILGAIDSILSLVKHIRNFGGD